VNLELIPKLSCCHHHLRIQKFRTAESFGDKVYWDLFQNPFDLALLYQRCTAPDEAMYRRSSAFSNGLDMTAKVSMYIFRSSKAGCCSGPHWKVPEPFSALKKMEGFVPQTSI
jgi:hypothetical protein